MQSKTKTYIIGILIALGFYILSMFLGSFINVLVAFTAGFDSFAAFQKSENIAGILVVLISTLANHLFFAWLTAKKMLKYGMKQGFVDLWYYVSAAFSVLVFAIIVRLITGGSGWLGFVLHSVTLVLFGRAKLKKYQRQFDDSDGLLYPTMTQDNAAAQNTATMNTGSAGAYVQVPKEEKGALYCSYCGAKLVPGDSFCRECGKPVYQSDK